MHHPLPTGIFESRHDLYQGQKRVVQYSPLVQVVKEEIQLRAICTTRLTRKLRFK